jgi:branched-chain amino acid aminotransferase
VTDLTILDGIVMPSVDAQISVSDEGFLRGDGVFEVIRVYAGRPFALDEHLVRMARSAGNLRLEFSPLDIEQDVARLLDQAGPVDGALRVLVTRGGRRIGIVEPLHELPPTIALGSVEYSPTRVLDQIKSLSYAANMLARRLAVESGADDALLITPHGRVLEGPTSSFFYVLDGKLYTPPIDDHILESITRRLVLEVSDAEERITTRDDIASFEEAFLASTLREVHPVHAIDARQIAAPGPVTERTSAAVREHIEAILAS